MHAGNEELISIFSTSARQKRFLKRERCCYTTLSMLRYGSRHAVTAHGFPIPYHTRQLNTAWWILLHCRMKTNMLKVGSLLSCKLPCACLRRILLNRPFDFHACQQCSAPADWDSFLQICRSAPGATLYYYLAQTRIVPLQV